MTTTPLVKVWRRDGTLYRHVVAGGTITAFEALNVEIVHNAPGIWSLTLPLDHVQAGVFLTHGRKARVTVDLPDRGVRFTGRVRRMVPYRDDSGRQLLDVSGVGALDDVLGLLCYPDPTASAEAQLLTRYTDLGPAEDVLRRLIHRNAVQRRGLPVTVAESQGRGPQQGLNLFFDSMLEVVTSVASRKGIGVRAGLTSTSPAATSASMLVDFYAPRDQRKRATLTPASGTVRSWRQEEAAPTGTHAVVAAGYQERTYDVTETSTVSDTMVTSAPHRLWTGDVVRFSGKADPPAPLRSGQAYFAIRAGASIFKVAATRTHALAGSAINLTAAPSAGSLQVTEVSRTVREVVAPGAEADDWDLVKEVFVDARNAEEDQVAGTITEAGLAALNEHTGQGSAEVVTTESEFIRFGTGPGQLYLGDTGRLQLVEEWGRDDHLAAAKVSVTREAGTVVEMVFGNTATSPLRRQADLFKALQRRIRHLEQGSA